MAKNRDRRNQQGEMDDARGDEVSIPAVRHVGPTLESDPKYMDVENLSDQTPESLIQQGIGLDESNVRDIVSRGTETEPRSRQEGALRPDEPLKTRLLGDTSSDPHTDVGPENASTVQRRPGRDRNAA